jgi:hypothetical protein
VCTPGSNRWRNRRKPWPQAGRRELVRCGGGAWRSWRIQFRQQATGTANMMSMASVRYGTMLTTRNRGSLQYCMRCLIYYEERNFSFPKHWLRAGWNVMHLEHHLGHFLSVPQGTHWELSGNGLWTLWERVVNSLGTHWELCGELVGNSLGTEGMHLNVFLHFTFIHYQIVYTLYYILYN